MNHVKYNETLLELCHTSLPDLPLAKELLNSGIALNTLFEPPKMYADYEYSPTTYLAEAAAYGNYELAKLLIAYGADPNLRIGTEPILWGLQYYEYYHPERNKGRLQAAELLLQSGVSPIVEWENETLFDYICFKIFNDDTDAEEFNYLSDFFLLLIIYGGKTAYCSPQIYIPFDKNNLQQYRFRIQENKTANTLYGEIFDNKGNIIAII